MWPTNRMLLRAIRSRPSCLFHQRYAVPIHHRAFASSVSGSGVTIGILRENYDKWERRAPICPQHVEQLLKKHSPTSALDNIIVQPCSRRVFTNEEYQQAGALVQDDLSQADVILGVKRPKGEDTLLNDKAYLFFSHVIKGQAENMSLLERILEQKIQLVDYECIRKEHPETGNVTRVVAFGKYAGMAGMMDTFHVLGQRLLSKCATPFLHCPPSSMHSNLDNAKACVQALGESIRTHGLAAELEPLVFCLTGKGGNVHSGVMEIMQHLPYQEVTVDQLPELLNRPEPKVEHQVYVLNVGVEEMYQHATNPDFFEFQHLIEQPSEYISTFADKIAPYIHVLVNGVYWDDRFPRMLTKEHMQQMALQDTNRLLLLTDISCDINGSVEFLERSTTIERPFFYYDPILQRETQSNQDGVVTILGVDILPSELPRESSTHFGDSLVELIDEVIQDHQAHRDQRVDFSKLSKSWSDACITTTDGSLAHSYKYLEAAMAHKTGAAAMDHSASKAVIVLFLKGHLFDSGLINQILDVIEDNHCGFEFVECVVQPPQQGVRQKSTVLLRINSDTESVLSQVESRIASLVQVMARADAILKRYHHPTPTTTSIDVNSPTAAGTAAVTVESPLPPQQVLLLGAGRVTASLVDLLGRSSPSRTIVVASDDETAAKEIANRAAKGRPVPLDAGKDAQRLSELVRESDIVVSLLPTPMHPMVAEECIRQKTNLVTASYESDDMRALEQRARDANIAILNEVGLDPGLDHMSAMKIIDDIHERGGTVASFSSVCGGLPSPEAADNPLKYKFSWSPMGVIRASQNDARYRWDGKIVEVQGKELLPSAAPFLDAWPEMHLECLPNRNSLIYEQKYGIYQANTLFRGTLRFRGFSSLMHIFRNMGLFDDDAAAQSTWKDVLDELRLRQGKDFMLDCANDDPDEATRAMECLEWLGVTGNAPLKNPESIAESFCHVLEDKLRFEDHERDMVLMNHVIVGLFEDEGNVEVHKSNLVVYGDDDLTAMSKTVGYTAAAATELVLNGGLSEKEVGLVLPTSKHIYNPVLDAMEKEGIKFSDSVEKRDSSGYHPSIANRTIHSHMERLSMD